MARKRSRPTIIGTIHESTDAALRAAVGGQWGKRSAILEAALRQYLGLPAEIESNGPRVAVAA